MAMLTMMRDQVRWTSHPLAAAACAAVLWPVDGRAQQSVSDVLQFLVTNQSIATGSFERDRAAAESTSATIGGALLSSLATLPVTSSSGAFVYQLNTELGTVERTTASFGPLFTERALTAGRGSAAVGLTLQHFRFTQLDGRPLRNGTLVTTANQFIDEPTPFDEDRLTLDIDADISTLYGSVGVTDRIDVGVAAPFIALRMAGSRINTYRGRTFTQATASARAVGVADIITRAKVALYAVDGAGLAAAVDVRWPTGNRADLLGTGRRSIRVMAIGSIDRERTAAHANVGISVGGLARELSGSLATAVVASSRLTIVGEVQGRHLRQPGHIATRTAPHPSLVGVQTLRLGPEGAVLTSLTVAPGLKWNVGGSWVAVGNVTIPLLRQGLTSPFVPFVGLDWSAGR